MSTINIWILIWILGGLVNVSYMKFRIARTRKKPEVKRKLDNKIEQLDQLLQQIDILCTTSQLYKILYVTSFIISWGMLGAMIASSNKHSEESKQGRVWITFTSQ